MCWVIAIAASPTNAHIGDAACTPNTCAGSNAYLRVNDCIPNNNKTSCLNNGVTESVPVYCTTADCTGGAPGKNGCSGLTPFQNGAGAWDCPDPQGGNVSCCSNSGGGGGGGASPTSGGGGGGGGCQTGRFKVKGYVRNSDGSNIRDQDVAQVVYSNGSMEPLHANATSGQFSLDKCWSSVPGGTFWVRALSLPGKNIFRPDGNPGGGCQLDTNGIDGNRYYDCNVSSYQFANDSTAGGGFNFTEEAAAPPANNPPECTNISIPTTITKGTSYAYQIGARDPDAGTANGSGIEYVESYWRFTDNSNSWTLVSSDDSNQPYNYTLDTNEISFSGASKDIYVVANVIATDETCTAANCTTGNSAANASQFTISAACRKTVTVTPPACAGVEISSLTRVCNASNNMQATLNWTHQAGATNYAIAIDDDPDFWTDSNAGNEVGAAPYAREETGGNGSNRSWSGPFPAGTRWYYRIRVTSSTSCTPQNWAYGATQSTIITCAGPSPTTVSYSCTGSIPAGGTACANDNTGLPSNLAWQQVASCDNTRKCQYTVQANVPSCDFTQGGGDLSVNSSQVVSATSGNSTSVQLFYKPPGGSFQVLGTETGTNASISRNLTCQPAWAGNTVQIACNAYNASASCTGDPTGTNPSCGSDDYRTVNCVGFSCTGTRPANTSIYSNDDSGLTSNLGWQYADPNTNRKCQYYCNSGFQWDGNSCEAAPNTCAGVEISSLTRVCNASNNMQATLNWTHQAGASMYAIAIDDDPDFWTDSNAGNEVGAAPYAREETGGNGSNRSWSGPFPAGTRWYYRIRVTSSTSCTPQNWAYGATQSTIITCAGPSPTTVPFACTGTQPANTSIYANDDTGLTQNLSWQYADPNTNRKCQYYCSTGYEWDGNSCEPVGYVCTGSIPAGGAACSNDDTGLTSNLAWLQVANCNNNRKCQYTVAPTPTTTAYSCTGNRPSGTSIYANDDTGLTSDLAWAYGGSNTNRKCQYYCSTGYEWDGNSCEPVGYVCTGSIPAGGAACSNDDTGLTSNLAWLQVANCNNNRKCQYTVAPTNTPVPQAQDCASPANLSCGGSCTSNGEMQVNCTWTRDTRVSGFRFRYDDDSGFGSDSTPINLTTDGTSANATYTMSAPLPNVQHWFRVSNRESDGTCVADQNQTSNTATTGPATCTTYACTGTLPGNTTIYANDNTGLTSNLSWQYAASNTNRKCQFACNSGYTWDGDSCETTSYTCGGTRPANTLYYSGDNNPASSGVNWVYASANTTAKCEFFCDTGHEWNAASATCELPVNACVAPTTTAGAITCADGGTLTGSWNGVSGAATYRFQRNTSASTNGAMQATISGTSFSVPIDEPDVMNYFRVRVQTVASSASCTAPGTWSAWRSVAANANCAGPTATPEPTPTDVPTTCNRPNAVTVTEVCTPNPQIGASWDKVAGVLRYEYQIKRAGEGWPDRVDEGVVAQPPGSTIPSMPTYLTEANPPDYNVRVHSVCSDGAGGEIVSNWRTGTSNFTPPACGGPSPTPLSYAVDVRLRVTDDNVCSSSGTNEDPFLSGTFTSSMLVDEVGYVGPTFTPMPINSATFTLNGLRNMNNVQPRYSQFSNNEIPGWTKAVCQIPVYSTVQNAADSPIDFFLSVIQGPWWQSSFGDVYANVISSKIPPTATNQHLSITGGGSEAGAVVWNSSIDLSTGTPSQKGYRIGNESLPFQQDFAYFASKLGSATTAVANINTINPNVNGFYRATGNQTFTSTWNNVTGKIVILIDNPGAQLTVQGVNPITVASGGFIFFVVNGPISFSAEVDQVYGMFLATDDISIAYDISNQDSFEGHGSFVSTSGDIVSNRSLSGNDNNTDPATEFIYEPSLVINTPNQLRTNTTVWQEVAP